MSVEIGRGDIVHLDNGVLVRVTDIPEDDDLFVYSTDLEPVTESDEDSLGVTMQSRITHVVVEAKNAAA